MFNPKKFLDTPIYDLTAAARMTLTALQLNGIVYTQSHLQVQHMATVRQRAELLTGRPGGFIATYGEYALVVVDSILPDDYQRRTVICMDTEVLDVRNRMFRAGLLPSDKKE